MITVSDGMLNPTTRDTTGLTGGVPGNVNTTTYSYTKTGQGVTAFEWNALHVLDNYSDAGESVALYAQTNAYGKGPIWAACFEANDHNGLGAVVACEFDIWTKTPDNGAKVALDVCLNGSNVKGATTPNIGATAVLRSSSGSDTATWTFGAILDKILECGVLVKSRLAGATRGIQLVGKFVVGLDLSTSDCQSAIRLAPGQRMTFEPTDQISWSWLNGRLRVQNGSVSVLEIDTGTGDIYKKGVKVL